MVWLKLDFSNTTRNIELAKLLKWYNKILKWYKITFAKTKWKPVLNVNFALSTSSTHIRTFYLVRFAIPELTRAGFHLGVGEGEVGFVIPELYLGRISRSTIMDGLQSGLVVRGEPATRKG